MHTTVLIYVLNVGLGGGGAKIDIKKICSWNCLVRPIIGTLSALFTYFLPDYSRKRSYRLKKKNVVANNILCLVRYIYFIQFYDVL